MNFHKDAGSQVRERCVEVVHSAPKATGFQFWSEVTVLFLLESFSFD
jgi:hypothetical protein